ncbi:MAG: ATP-binding protein [Mesosutterella sp.]|nr:ATP-binding protein [Mesosutterella sp.]
MTDGLTKGIEIDKCFNALNRKDLIVIEDFGLFPATEASIQLLFRLIDRRFGMGALLITSQYKVGDWYGYFAGEQNNNALADAVMDRLRNNSQNIELKGPSLKATNPRI